MRPLRMTHLTRLRDYVADNVGQMAVSAQSGEQARIFVGETRHLITQAGLV